MNKNTNSKWNYASLGSQFMLGLLLFVYFGLKTDNWLQFKTPIFVWILPLLLIIASIIKLIIETGKKNKSE